MMFVPASVQLRTVLFGGKVTTLIVRLQHKSRSMANTSLRSSASGALTWQPSRSAERSDSALIPALPKSSGERTGEEQDRTGARVQERLCQGEKREAGDKDQEGLDCSAAGVKQHQGNAEGPGSGLCVSEKAASAEPSRDAKCPRGDLKTNACSDFDAARSQPGTGTAGYANKSGVTVSRVSQENDKECHDVCSDGEDFQEASLWPRLETFLLSIRYRFLQIEKLRAARQRQEGLHRGLLTACSKESTTGRDDPRKGGMGLEHSGRGLGALPAGDPTSLDEEEDKPLLYQVPLLMPVQKFPVDVKVLAPRTGRVSTPVVVALLFSNCSAVGV